jgi:hypothetical protein
MKPVSLEAGGKLDPHIKPLMERLSKALGVMQLHRGIDEIHSHSRHSSR